MFKYIKSIVQHFPDSPNAHKKLAEFSSPTSTSPAWCRSYHARPIISVSRKSTKRRARRTTTTKATTWKLPRTLDVASRPAAAWLLRQESHSGQSTRAQRRRSSSTGTSMPTRSTRRKATRWEIHQMFWVNTTARRVFHRFAVRYASRRMQCWSRRRVWTTRLRWWRFRVRVKLWAN